MWRKPWERSNKDRKTFCTLSRHEFLLAAKLKTFIVSAGHSPPRRRLPRLVPHGSQLFGPCFELGLIRKALQPCYTLFKVTFCMEVFPLPFFLWKCECFLAQKPSSHRKFWFHQTPENFQKESLGPALRMTIAPGTITICSKSEQMTACYLERNKGEGKTIVQHPHHNFGCHFQYSTHSTPLPTVASPWIPRPRQIQKDLWTTVKENKKMTLWIFEVVDVDLWLMQSQTMAFQQCI